MEMRIYIANLGKYNEGELVGDWFTPPIDFEEVRERIGLNDRYEEYAIHDYELPFTTKEYESIDEINRQCEMAQELCDFFDEDDIRELCNAFFSDIAELYENRYDIIYYSGIDNMTNLAIYLIDECNSLGDIPDNLKSYIDYESYGRDLEINGRFLVTNNGIYEVLQ